MLIAGLLSCLISGIVVCFFVLLLVRMGAKQAPSAPERVTGSQLRERLQDRGLITPGCLFSSEAGTT